jgi:sulfane dehydrogenase subunit SoxC
MARLSRRAMLGATGGLIAGGLLKTQADALSLGETPPPPQQVPQDPTKVLGRGTSDLGQRAPDEQPRRAGMRPGPSSSSRTPIHELRGIITPADLHFERHHGGIPNIDPET